MANPSRPPHGGRGLKCGSYCVRVSERLSSSTRGTWIEIVCGLLWIEMCIHSLVSKVRFVVLHTGDVD